MRSPRSKEASLAPTPFRVRQFTLHNHLKGAQMGVFSNFYFGLQWTRSDLLKQSNDKER